MSTEVLKAHKETIAAVKQKIQEVLVGVWKKMEAFIDESVRLTESAGDEFLRWP